MKSRIVFLGFAPEVPNSVVLEVEAIEPDVVTRFIMDFYYQFVKTHNLPLKPVGELSPEERLGREIYRALQARNEK